MDAPKEKSKTNWVGWVFAGIIFIIFRTVPELKGISAAFLIYAVTAGLIYLILKKIKKVPEELLLLLSVYWGFTLLLSILGPYGKIPYSEYLYKIVLIPFLSIFLILRRKWAWFCFVIWISFEAIANPIYFLYTGAPWTKAVTNFVVHAFLLSLLFPKKTRDFIFKYERPIKKPVPGTIASS